MEIEFMEDESGNGIALFIQQGNICRTSKLYYLYKDNLFNDRRAIIFERPEFCKTDIQAYSDWQPDWYDNYDEIFNKYFTKGKCLSDYKPSLIEQFLCELEGEPIMLTGIVEEFEWGSSYWCFFYKDKERLQQQGLLEKQKEGIPKSLDKIEYSNPINKWPYVDDSNQINREAYFEFLEIMKDS